MEIMHNFVCLKQSETKKLNRMHTINQQHKI